MQATPPQRLRTSERGVPGWLYAPRALLPPPRGLRPPSSPKLALLRLPAVRGVVACKMIRGCDNRFGTHGTICVRAHALHQKMRAQETGVDITGRADTRRPHQQGSRRRVLLEGRRPRLQADSAGPHGVGPAAPACIGPCGPPAKQGAGMGSNPVAPVDMMPPAGNPVMLAGTAPGGPLQAARVAPGICAGMQYTLCGAA